MVVTIGACAESVTILKNTVARTDLLILQSNLRRLEQQQIICSGIVKVRDMLINANF